jgi:hypothetical protein
MPLQTVLRIAVLALALLPSLAQARILTIHELAADPKRYDGQYITVRAVADFGGAHNHFLVHSPEVYIRNNKDQLNKVEAERSCVTVDNDLFFTSLREKNRIQGRTVTVSGIFIADMFGGREGLNLSGCQTNKRFLEVDKVHRID